MLVGPRAACDAIWDAWAPTPEPACFYDQRLYVCTEVSEGPRDPELRLASQGDHLEVVANARAMELEDLGHDPAADSLESFRRSAMDRIQDGRTWVSGPPGALRFQVSVGTRMALGCQVGGTWVPPELRGQGLATMAMRSVTAQLLTQHPFVSLHVNEANVAAVTVYERAGYEPSEPYRLIRV